MPQKLRDLAVKTGSYTDSSGQEKGRWQNIGALMKSDDGGEFIILHRWFNPAGVPNPEDRDSLLVSCFKTDRDGQSGGGGQGGATAQHQAPAPQQHRQAPPQQNPNQAQGFQQFDSEIPF